VCSPGLLQTKRRYARTLPDASHPMLEDLDHGDTSSDSSGADAKNHDGIVVGLSIVTGDIDFAGSETGAVVSFRVDKEWTNEVPLMDASARGAVVEKRIEINSWPSRMRIRALGGDRWYIESIQLSHNNRSVVVLGSVGVSSSHWIDDTAVTAFDVPSIHSSWRGDYGNCTTREDPRVDRFGYITSEPGTPCVFGADVRDEDSHCIMEEEYGSYGWCYTSKDQTSWGSCSENCPLVGQHAILGKKLDQLLDGQQQIRAAQTSAEDGEPAGSESDETSEDGNDDEAAAHIEGDADNEGDAENAENQGEQEQGQTDENGSGEENQGQQGNTE